MNKKQLIKYLSIIGDANRLAILSFLKGGESCACEIHPKLKIAQNLSSHHLKVLKNLKLIKSRRDGVKIYYSRDEDVIRTYQELLSKEIE